MSELSEHSQKSPKNTSGIKQNSAKTKKTINDGSPQGVNRDFSEHSLVSLDPMRNIQNLHIQQRQNCLQGELPKVNETHSESPRSSQPQEANLISFTPLHGQQGTNERNSDESKRQRSPRKRKQKDEWQTTQGQFEQNREISHISPGGQGNIFNMEEPSISYLQLPTRTTQENNKVCMKCGETGHWKHYCRTTTWCKFCMSETHATQACRRYANFVRDNPITSIRRTTPVQDQKRVETIRPSAPVGHQQEIDRRQLFPHPPTQHFQAPEIPSMVTGQR